MIILKFTKFFMWKSVTNNVVLDIIGDNEEEDQYNIILVFTHPQFLTAASSKVRVNRVALSPSSNAVCSL